MRLLARIVALTLCTVVSFVALPPSPVVHAGTPIVVKLNGKPVILPENSTMGDLLAATGLLPPKGNLVSVRGRVLRANAVSGYVEINGTVVAAAQLLSDGDSVVLMRGKDVREPTERVTIASTAIPGNPIRVIPPGLGQSVAVIRGWISKEVLKEEPFRGKARSAVALTFDDGPNPIWTPQVLRILARQGVKATFFVTGRNAQRYPHLIRAIHKAGHSIQNHSWNHEKLTGLPRQKLWQSLRDTTRQLRRAGLPMPTWFRPPYGLYNAETMRMARALGMRNAMWSVDPADYRQPPAYQLTRRVMSQVSAGGIILLHDAGGNRANTVAALEGIIVSLKRRGYRFATLS